MRCPWVPPDDALMAAYHDEEWGVPVHDEQGLYELLVLEGAQAGLSWSLVLRRREGYRRAFARFDPEAVARYAEADEARLLADPGIVRNRLKVASAVENARAVVRLREEGGLARVVWAVVGGRPLQNRWQTLDDVPAQTAESRALSRELRRRGFRFVGPTICYALMQAAGLVNDHLVSCPRQAELEELASRPAP